MDAALSDVSVAATGQILRFSSLLETVGKVHGAVATATGSFVSLVVSLERGAD